MTWDDIALRHGTDKASSGHDYMRHYETWLCDLHPERVLEIGVHQGQSLRTWADIWPTADVLGIDVLPGCKQHERGRVHVLIGDATDPATFAPLTGIEWDLIVDDGSHQTGDILASLGLLAPSLTAGGFYIIEDLALGRGAPVAAVMDALEDHYLQATAMIESAGGHHAALLAR